MTRARGARGRAARAFAAGHALTLVVMLGLLLAWEAAVAVFAVPSFLVPAPRAILRALVRFWDLLLFDAWVTTVETLLGFAVGSLVGLALAVAITLSPTFERIVYPPLVLTQVVPKLAVAPLFVVWFGVGVSAKVMIAVLVCLFPVLVNTVAGIRTVDPRMLDLMRAVNASRWQVFWKVQLPHSAPYVFAGLKVGITLAVVGAIVGEWLGSNAGLGHLILIANSQLRADLLFAALLMLGAVGVGLFGAIALLGAWLVPHRRVPDTFDTL